MERYTRECLAAAKSSPQPALTAEQMRQQVRRNHEESMRRMRPLIQDMRPEDLSAVILGKKMMDKYTKLP